MAARLIDGKAQADLLIAAVAEHVADILSRGGRPPGLAVVLVGENAASHVYVRNKLRQSGRAGVRSFEHRLPASVAQAELLSLVASLNADDAVDGILVQLPLPDHIDAARVLNAVDPGKDVDGFHPVNAGRLAIGQPGLVPCTPRGCVHLLRSLGVALAGLHAVVVGRSNIVGKPLAQLLLGEDCTVTIAHSRTRDLASVCRSGDILVAAVGRAGMIGRNHVRPGAIVLDVGINRAADGRLVGDVDFNEVVQVASAITPVPGGVGPMTIACLLENTLAAHATRA